MNLKGMIRAICGILFVIGLAMLSSVIVGWLLQDPPQALWWMLISSFILLLTSTIGIISIRLRVSHWDFREGLGIAAFAWIGAGLFGSLPFFFIADFHWFDALFESMSGFTTTGASVIAPDLVLRNGRVLGERGIEVLPKCLLFWRSMTHWLGGMGIVALSVAILPFLGIGSQSMIAAELPGPTGGKITARIADSAKILWGIYLLLSLIETVALRIAGMNWFDAWCHTCGTMATGGFSTRIESIGAFQNAYIEWIIILFMFLAGCNFILHFQVLKGQINSFWNSEEFRFYLLIIIFSCLLITGTLYWTQTEVITSTGEKVSPTFFNVLRYALFQVVSILTTTGFCTADFNLWSPSLKILLIILMFLGGCGGSTGGGIKHARIILGLKYLLLQIRRSYIPHHLADIRLDGKRIANAVVHRTLAFILLFVLIFIILSWVLGFLPGFDTQTAVTASIACLGNVGPGLGRVGPLSSYAWIHPVGKVILTFAMLLGRLELYTIMVIFLPSFWKH